MTRRDRARKRLQRRAHALRLDTRHPQLRAPRPVVSTEDRIKVLLRQGRIKPVVGRPGLFRTVR